MNVGTKSLLFGVHQFLWHPYTVARAWRFLYGRWPSLAEWVCIFCHDLGYWGKPNMDGAEGQSHPEFGARLATKLVAGIARLRFGCSEQEAVMRGELAAGLTLYHSRYYAAKAGHDVSALFLPDKLSLLFEPRWFYLLRATLSGEIKEYMANAGDRVPGPKNKWTWHAWYERKVLSMLASSSHL